MKVNVFADFETEIQIEEGFYTVKGTARAEHLYLPGRMYMPNGDPGYPEENELEITDIEFVATNEDEDEVTDSELLKKIDSELTDWLNEKDNDFWTYPED